jgi:glycosyltransferase involved in cell wall biosynthesis
MVSVVIPCYNQAHFLAEAIESVRAQTVTDVEIIVVDDGSTDDTLAVARQLGVRCVTQRNQGQGAARNHGLSLASGEFIVFLDSDDRLRPHALETGLRLLSEHPDCVLAAGRCVVFNEHGVRTEAVYRPVVTENHYLHLLHSNYIWMPGSAMLRTEIVRRLGGFRTDVTGAEDYDLYLRIARDYRVWCHDEFVAEYRQHSTSTSRRAALMLKSTVKVMTAQRDTVRGRPHEETALRNGMRYWQQEFGEDTVKDIRRRLRTGDWWNMLPPIMTLARYYPGAFWHHLRRKLARIVRGKAPEGLEDVVG